MKFSLVFLVFLLFISYAKCQSEEDNDIYFSSSVSEMVYLQKLKYLLISDLELYAKELKSKLELTKKAIDHMEIQLRRLEENIESDEYHRINYFSCLRIQHLDWAQWLKFMRENVAIEAQDHVQEMRKNLPIHEDFVDALGSVLLLGDTYQIKPKDFAKGLLNGRQYNSSLDPLDLYALGQFAFKKSYYNDANDWLYLTCLYYLKWEDAQVKFFRFLGLQEIELSQLYATNLLKINNKFLAWIVVEEAPWHAPLYRRLKLIERDFYVPTRPEKSVERAYYPNYHNCCRGEFENPKGLSCYYDFGAEPFLLLAPFKVELLNRDPYVAIYHDILYDSEIKELKRIAVPTIRRSTVFDFRVNKYVAINLRTSNTAHLYPDDSYVVEFIRRRIEDMTNLNIFENSSDLLQVMNYGLGGHFSPHLDFFGSDFKRCETMGDRIITTLLYMTNVQQGGATVFPNLALTNFPQKGTALIFRNLDNSLTPISDTVHAGCPVLFGSKWASTQWIYSFEQMFRKPCLAAKHK